MIAHSLRYVTRFQLISDLKNVNFRMFSVYYFGTSSNKDKDKSVGCLCLRGWTTKESRCDLLLNYPSSGLTFLNTISVNTFNLCSPSNKEMKFQSYIPAIYLHS
jgi:hypothetical protein